MPSADPFLPPPATPPEPPRRREAASRELEVGEPLRRDAARAAIALLVALLLHAGAWFTVPDDLASAIDVLNDPPPPRRSIELSFEPQPEVAPEDQRYVDTNPDKPSNRPDETPNISDRDQQAAQETDEGEIDPENNPRSEGDEADSMRVVEGNLTEPEPYVPPAGVESPSQDPAEATEAAQAAVAGAPPPAASRPDFLEANPETTEGLGSYLREPQPMPEPAEGRSPEVNAVLNEEVAEAAANPAAQAAPQGQQVQPRPRPRLSPQVIAGPTLQNFARAEDVGVVGLDAYRSDMGEYLREVLGVISLHWQNLARQTYRSTGEQRATVVVEFWINQDGSVDSARVVESTGQRAAELICIDGVTGRAPYRPWTEDMKKTLGERQSIRIRFLYY